MEYVIKDNNEKLGIIIQARLNSSRLPNKIILPFYNEKCMFELLISRLKDKYSNISIIVATTDKAVDDKLVELSKKLNVDVFRGDEENVLSRFIDCAKLYNIEKIIRVCSDNLLIDFDFLDMIINELKLGKYDYVSFCLKNKTPVIMTHYGFFAEGVTLSALLKANSLINEQEYLEHVTNFIYQNNTIFNILLKNLPGYIENNQNIRLTVDTLDDFIIVKQIYRYFIENNIVIKSSNVIDFLASNLSIIDKMERNIKNNLK